MNRIEAREKAFLSLFEWSFSEEAELNIIEETNDYSKYILINIKSKIKEIDNIINKYVKNWNTKRISRVAITALRIALFEIDNIEEIDFPVSINEAVNIVKKYDNIEAASFVNGILGSYVKDKYGNL